MIEVLDNKQCCGCHACENVCPKHCIEMVIDDEGFHYPKVNLQDCINCHLCEKVCPMLHPGDKQDPVQVEAMRFGDEVKRLESSSGGVFTALAEHVISQGGVVFGAAWTDDWYLEHQYTEDIEGLQKFRGSKYVQSEVNDAYIRVRDFLKQDRWVLFSGTPCQVRGLHLFLRKSYDKLVTVDFICHGVPSVKVLHAYIKDEVNNYIRQDVGKNSVLLHSYSSISKENALTPPGWELKGIRFRDKTNGWKKYSFALTLAKAAAEGEKNTVLLSPLFTKSAYMRGYGADIYLRPSCHTCPSKNFSSGSDFTLADYWGVHEQHPEIDDDKGTSLIAINSDKAMQIIDSLNLEDRLVVDGNQAYRLQTALFYSMQPSKYRDEFWASDWQNNFSAIVNRICSRRTVKQRIVESVKFVLRNLGVKKVYKYIKKNL